jgi:hypothetical protein
MWFIPYYDAFKLAFTVWLLFFNGAHILFDRVIEPYYAKYEKAIDSKVSKLSEEMKEIAYDPDALKNLILQETEMIKKHGEEAYHEMLVKAAYVKDQAKKYK